jgi:hypothetical protein
MILERSNVSGVQILGVKLDKFGVADLNYEFGHVNIRRLQKLIMRCPNPKRRSIATSLRMTLEMSTLGFCPL